MKNSEEMFDVGFRNSVLKSRVLSLIAFDSDPVRRVCAEIEKMQRVIDASKGRKVKTAIYLDSGHVVLSAVALETLLDRFHGERSGNSNSSE
jgi:regulator of extracellular matrix RemA (YlzA/DUF370 family)